MSLNSLNWKRCSEVVSTNLSQVRFRVQFSAHVLYSTLPRRSHTNKPKNIPQKKIEPAKTSSLAYVFKHHSSRLRTLDASVPYRNNLSACQDRRAGTRDLAACAFYQLNVIGGIWLAEARPPPPPPPPRDGLGGGEASVVL
jgi:hypothetical protein